jgi:hypothetical protein
MIIFFSFFTPKPLKVACGFPISKEKARLKLDHDKPLEVGQKSAKNRKFLHFFEKNDNFCNFFIFFHFFSFFSFFLIFLKKIIFFFIFFIFLKKNNFFYFFKKK